MKPIYFIIFILFLLRLQLAQAQQSHDFEISKNLDIYTSLIQQLDLHYVDEIQPGKLSKASIDAMLKQIDPYTVYYPESKIEDVRFMQTGKYGGIGAAVHIKNGKVIVGMTYPGFPFYESGIRPGDILLEIDNESVDGKKMSEISERLRGVSGTDISIKYKKTKESIIVDLKMHRADVKINDVPYFGMLEEGIAYVKLSSFRKTAAKEVKEAIDSLNKNGELKSLVFDLRDNGGGLLIQAVNIMDLFVGVNELIVSTKGKTKKEYHRYSTRSSALYPELKIAVLTNNRSASASEIVAGSFQDLDRGVILGQKSYGKGLVQKVYSLSYRSQVKITVAKYYIPSGRCIQSLDYLHKDSKGNAVKTPDSLMAVFKTRNGRLVKDAGGIIPDIDLEAEQIPKVVLELANKYVIFDFATNYIVNNDSIENISDFAITDKLYDSFVKFVDSSGFVYVSESEKQIEILKKQFVEDGFKMTESLNELEAFIISEKKKDFISHKKLISELIFQEIISRYYYKSGRIEAQLQDDDEVQAAIRLLKDSKRYSEILKLKQ